MGTRVVARHRAVYRRLAWVAPTVLIAAATACGPVRRNAGPAPATLVFTNDALYEAPVYVVVPGVEARRIGTVMPGQTETLVVPVDLTTRAESVNIVARVPSRFIPQTGPITIRPGQRYEVRLPPDARMLSIVPARQ
jgi:hypothetical protein